MSKLQINTIDLTEEFTLDMYQKYTCDHIEEMLLDEYNAEHNTNYDYDDFTWNFEPDNVLFNLAYGLETWLEENYKAIRYVKVYETGSPKEYNYVTDWAELMIDYDKDKVDEYIEEHEKEYLEYTHDSGWRSTIDSKLRKEDADDCIEKSKLAYYLHTVNGDQSETIYWKLAEIADSNWYEYTTMTLKED